ncbi:Bro-N domain-containing protein [Acinetobacter baumannii]|nr:Bro-N domain-containing protein [Acinetobacter baumannii]HBI8868956.1 Bro-N domain-containing protein [Acinetobacter baumannii]HBI8872499.1 Bro-N domain-containing protein [Acinetobacter baumannii]
MMQLQIFEFESDDSNLDNLTTIEIDNEIWFVANEVCRLLDIKNASDAVSRLDDDEKQTSVIPISGQNRQVNLISESGLYALIFKSNKPSAKQFRKWVTKEVIPSIRKKGSYGINRLETPNFIVRFNDNWDRTDKGYFSVISELFIRLYGRFEKIGYQIPNKAFTGKEIRPDVSVGLRFSKFLKQKYPEHLDKFKMYNHKFPDGSEVEARQYQNILLPIFIQFVDEIWIPECASDYFKDRDPIALNFVPKLLN